MTARPLPRLLTVACLLACLSVLAAETVGRIRVVDLTGNSNQADLEQLVNATVSTRVGGELTPVRLSDDLKALLKAPGISDAQTKVDRLDDGTWQVTYLVSLRHLVSAIRVNGATEYSESRLKRALKTRVGRPVDFITLAEDRRGILDRYEKAGFHGTEVSTRMEKDADGQPTILVFIVQESTRCKLQGVRFVGNHACSSDDLEDAIPTKRQWWRYIFRFGNWYNPNLQPQDIDKILRLYATRGYLDCQVERVERVYNEDKSWVTPTFHIREGRPYRLGKRTFTGNQRFTTQELLKACRLQEGQVYNAAQADNDLDAMKAKYEALGFLDLKFYPRLERHPESATVDIHYTIHEGDPLRIGNIVISGNTETRERVIRRELAIFEDDLADARKIRQSQRRLENLGYFSSVEVVPKATPSPGRRDLSIQVTEKPTGTISLGAAFSTEDNLMGYLELQESNFSLDRLLSLEWPPRGDGQRMRAYIAVGTDSTSIRISHTEPSLFDSQFDWTNEFFLTTHYEDEYDERHIGVSSTLSWPVAFRLPFLPNHTEYWRMGLGLRLEQIRISNLEDEEKFDPKTDPREPNEWRFPSGMNYSLEADKGSKFTNRVILSLTRDTRNRYIFPDRGSRLRLDAEYVTKALGSYADYIKFHAGADTFLPVHDDLFLHLAANAYTVSHLSGEDVRVFDRYFAGGYGAIRGFRRHYVSPVNRNENSIGGKTMLVATAELIQPVKDVMFLKLFTDWGNVWWDSWDADLGEINGSVGVGIQFRRIPIRLDYGYPVVTHGEHLKGCGGRFHFSIDYSF